jgi:hypothetical protein
MSGSHHSDEPSLDSEVATVHPYYEEMRTAKCGDGGLMLESRRRGVDLDLAHGSIPSFLFFLATVARSDESSMNLLWRSPSPSYSPE